MAATAILKDQKTGYFKNHLTEMSFGVVSVSRLAGPRSDVLDGSRLHLGIGSFLEGFANRKAV